MEHCALCPDEGVERIPAFLAVQNQNIPGAAEPEGEVVLCADHAKRFHDGEPLRFNWCAACGAWRTADPTCWDCESPLAN